MKTILAYPWLTEGAIAYLDSHLPSDARVLEFGAGGSTIWLAQRVRQLYSVEHQQKWLRQVQATLVLHGLDSVVDLRFRPTPYDKVCQEFIPESVDLVLIDGRDRVLCAQAAKQLVKHGGILMLDNAERARYDPIHDLLSGWTKNCWTQLEPRQLDGFIYPGWTTVWWVRP